eukprot:s2602_g6.t6
MSSAESAACVVVVAQPSPKKVKGKKAARSFRTRSVTWEKDEPALLVSPDPETSARNLMHKRRLQPKGKQADKNPKTASVTPKLSGQATQTDAPAGFWLVRRPLLTRTLGLCHMGEGQVFRHARLYLAVQALDTGGQPCKMWPAWFLSSSSVEVARRRSFQDGGRSQWT